MQEPVRIEKKEPLKEVEDLYFLKKKGLESIQQLSGDIWTDYNEHDPGVTILEYLCYALTELGFKSNFKDEDYLFLNQKKDDILFSLDKILSNGPITPLDFRKIIIDQIRGIKNVWVLPRYKDNTGADFNGLFDIFLQLYPDEDELKTKEEVSELFIENRNLSEDLNEVLILQSKEVTFHAEIVVSPDFIVENVLADILNRVSEFISPTISLFSYDEMIEKGYTKNEIFNGPKTNNGFLDTKQLEESSITGLSELNTNRIFQIIDSTEGVLELSEFYLIIDDVPHLDKNIKIEKGFLPELNVRKILSRGSTIEVFVGDIPYDVNHEIARYSYQGNVAKNQISHRRNIPDYDTERSSSFNTEELLNYESIQNHFPKSFGITQYGIQGRVTDERLGEVAQLKGYLSLFEKMIANQLAQLSKVGQLLSVKSLGQTYFENKLPHTKDDLGRLLDKYDNYLVRRNRFLNHLLARFGEESSSGSFEFTSTGSLTDNQQAELENIINSKEKLVRNFPAISYTRLRAFNYIGVGNLEEYTSGFKRKISYLFGFENAVMKRLSGFAMASRKLSNTKIEKETKKDFSSDEFTFHSDNSNFLGELLQYGLNENNYQIISSKNKKGISESNVIYIDPNKNYNSQTIFKAKTKSECEAAIKKLVGYLNKLGSESDGFHLIEHILLRPINNGQLIIFNAPDVPNINSSRIFKKEDFKALLLKFGSVERNFKVEKKGKLYQIVLTDDKSSEIAYNDTFILKKSAQQAIKEIVAFLKGSKSKSDGINNYIKEIGTQKGKYEISDASFFSNQISIVLPSWSFRFREKKHRMRFESICRNNLPAHLNVNFHWMDIQQMAGFEASYFPWLETKRKWTNPTEKLNTLSEEIAKILGS